MKHFAIIFSLFLLGGDVLRADSNNLIGSWNERFTHSSLPFTKLAYGNGRFVAGRALPQYPRTTSYPAAPFLTSTDARTWECSSGNNMAGLTDLIFVNGLFLGVGGSAICTSPDGTHWTVQGTNAVRAYKAVAYGNGIYVVCGSAGFYLSKDAANWKFEPLTNTVSSLAFGNARFVGVNTEGDSAISADGHSWSFQKTSWNSPFRHIIFAHENFLALSDTGLASSPDGITWTPESPDYAFGGDVLRYCSGKYFVSKGKQQIFESNDLQNWEELALSIDPASRPTAVADVIFDGHTYVLVGPYGPDTGIINTSTNGQDWITQPRLGQPTRAMTFNSHGFVIVGQSGVVANSRDGFTWLEHATPSTNDFQAVTENDDGTLVAVGRDGAIISSTNLVNWNFTQVQNPLENPLFFLRGVASGLGHFVAVGDGGSVFTSPDGINWTPRQTGVTNRLNAIAFGNSTFVAIGPSIILTSTNSIDWRIQTPPDLIGSLQTITFFEGQFMTIGGRVLKSSDGIEWTALWTQGVLPVYARSFAVGPGLIAAYGGSYPQYSTNGGYTWTPLYMPAPGLPMLAYGNKTIVAMGLAGLFQTDTLQLEQEVRIETASTGLRLTWPKSLRLLESTNLASTNWTEVTNTPASILDQKTILTEGQPTNHFYRALH